MSDTPERDTERFRVHRHAVIEYRDRRPEPAGDGEVYGVWGADVEVLTTDERVGGRTDSPANARSVKRASWPSASVRVSVLMGEKYGRS